MNLITRTYPLDLPSGPVMMRTEAGVKPWLEKNLPSALSSTSHARLPTYSVFPGDTEENERSI